jgi:hypothetical protein
VEHRLHTDATMEDAPLGSDMAESKDATELSVLFGMLQLVVARMLFQHSVPLMTMRMMEGVRIRWMLVCPTICPLVELDLLELRMDSIQILWNVPDRAMRSSMLRWRVIRRLTCWLTILILARYASICPAYSISNRFCTFWLIRFVSHNCPFR